MLTRTFKGCGPSGGWFVGGWLAEWLATRRVVTSAKWLSALAEVGVAKKSATHFI